MDALRKADRRVLRWAVAVWALVTIFGAFWALPHIEDELDEEALGVPSYTSVQGAVVEWNGRDGYLQVPAVTPDVEEMAANLADINGTRDVEIELVAGSKEPAIVIEEGETTPAAFEVTWDDLGASGSGLVPAGTEGEMNALFATGDGLSGDPNRTMSEATRSAVTDRLAPLIGTSLPSGHLNVDGDDITITGVATDQATLDELTARLDEIPGLTTNISAPATTPAQFRVRWDPTGVTQDGEAHDGSGPGLEALGVAVPGLGSGLTVGPDVDPAISALSPLLGSDLVEGVLTVDGDAVSITGAAPNAEALGRAETALAGTGAILDLTVSSQGAAQEQLDALLALGSIEFLTNTAIPTDDTEVIIDSVADILNEFKSIDVSIAGHTDSRGNDESNQVLSEDRANAVLQGLVDRGIDTSRMTAAGLGEIEPIDSNDTNEGRQHNRRVEIKAKESN